MQMIKDCKIGDLLYRTNKLIGIHDLYFKITDVSQGLIYVNPLWDLKGHWYVHDLADVQRNYRHATLAEKVLYDD